MPASNSQDSTAVIPRRRTMLDTVPVETLVFLDLNAGSDKPEPPERQLPDELTGFYYTG